MDYLKAFLVGGLLCVIGQILIDRTKLTPARILVAYVVAGVLLGAVGLYDKLVDFAGAGATVPLTGFGNTLARGIKKAVDEDGALGISTMENRNQNQKQNQKQNQQNQQQSQQQNQNENRR